MTTEPDIASSENLLSRDGELYYFPQIFTEAESASLFTGVKNGVVWKQEPIVLFGKRVMQPRLTAWYADDGLVYSYSGIAMTPGSWNKELLEIKSRVEQVTGCRYNSALLNFYRNGADSMGWHRDNEKELGKQPAIASVTFGAARKFQVRRYQTKNDLLNLYPTSGSCLLMKGAMQSHWEHALPKTKIGQSERINLTFRLIME